MRSWRSCRPWAGRPEQRPRPASARVGAALAHGNKALALHQPHHARAVRGHGAMGDAHTGQVVISASPTEQLANYALAARCGPAAQAYPVERRVDRGCHEVIFLPLGSMPEVSAMMARAPRGPS